MDNTFKIDVTALDSGQGYLLIGLLIVNGVRTKVQEHYDTEAALRTRLGTGFDIWAAQVDSE